MQLRVFLFVTFAIFNTSCAAQTETVIKNFSECVAAGNPVFKTFPARCKTKDGLIFEDGDKPAGAKVLCVDNCGNGQCEEIVCMAQGCPCPETAASCPKDCK